MLTRTTDAPVPIAEHVPNADARVFFQVDWTGYESLLALRGERSRPRIAYLDGVAELMTTSWNHESISRTVEHLFAVYLDEAGIEWTTLGEWTLKSKTKKAGLEPDGCYIFGEHPDPDARGIPELALEVTWTSGGIDKLEIYRRLGIPEVWFWERDAITVYGLSGDGYRKRRTSAFVPGIDFKLMCRLATMKPTSKAIRELRKAVRAKR